MNSSLGAHHELLSQEEITIRTVSAFYNNYFFDQKLPLLFIFSVENVPKENIVEKNLA